ncbi:12917_t:CDS:2 [Entrophospora sp. SA101]|nr:12917_t:CDS:2 [Entrophospora sp. SA101]
MADTHSIIDSLNERISKLEKYWIDTAVEQTELKKYQIVLEVQGSQHRLHNTSWYKDVKKLEDIVNRDRKKRCLCQLNGIYLIETWYDENPEVTIPEKIYKYREEIFNLS